MTQLCEGSRVTQLDLCMRYLCDKMQVDLSNQQDACQMSVQLNLCFRVHDIDVTEIDEVHVNI